MKIDPGQAAYGVVFQTLSACIAPRPVVLVATVSDTGAPNLAPFSMVTPLSAAPALLGLSILPRHGEAKDTLRNIEATGEFTVNAVVPRLADEAVRASADYGPAVSEFEACGLRPRASERVRPPRVDRSPVSLECRRVEVLSFPRSEARFVVGEVLLVHVDDDLVRDGALDAEGFCPLGHLGTGSSGYVFSTVGRLVRVPTPPWPGGDR